MGGLNTVGLHIQAEKDAARRAAADAKKQRKLDEKETERLAKEEAKEEKRSVVGDEAAGEPPSPAPSTHVAMVARVSSWQAAGGGAQGPGPRSQRPATRNGQGHSPLPEGAHGGKPVGGPVRCVRRPPPPFPPRPTTTVLLLGSPTFGDLHPLVLISPLGT